MRRDAKGWQREQASLSAAAFVPLSFDPGEAYARTVRAALAANEDGWLGPHDVDAARDVLFHGIAYLEAAAKWALQAHNEQCLREQAAAERKAVQQKARTHG